MGERLLVRGARQLITLRGMPTPRRGSQMSQLSIVTDGAMIVEDGKIKHIGPSSRVENLADAKDAIEIDAEGRAVLPAFIDSHTHLIFGPPRLQDFEMRMAGHDYEEIARAGGGILSSVRAVRGASARRLQLAARQHLARFARQGTGTLEVKSGYGLEEGSECKTLRLVQALHQRPLDLVPTFLGAHATPPEYQNEPDKYIDLLCNDLIPKIARRGLARFADVYCDRNAFSVAQARRYLEAARARGLGLKVHASQFANFGAVQLALEMDAVSVDHLEAITSVEVALLARSPTVATLLPGSVFHLGLERYPPARELIDAGAAVALATDFNPGTSPTSSMPMVIALACRHMKMTPAETIAATTINGAHALGIAGVTGSLEYGKQADFLILEVGDYREIPYYFGVNLAGTMVKSGRIIHQEKEFPWPED